MLWLVGGGDETFPVSRSYSNQLAGHLDGLGAADALARWCASLDAWERQAREHLPLRALREALELDHAAMMWVLTQAGFPMAIALHYE